MNTARRAALAVLVLMSAAAESQELERLKAQSYGDFSSLMRPVQLSQVRAAAPPPSAAGRPVRGETANRRRREAPWSIWQVVSRLERSGVRVARVYESKYSNLFGGPERGWGLVTSRGGGNAVILPGARDAEGLRVQKWRCHDPRLHCYLVRRNGRTVAQLHGGPEKSYFVMRRNVFFVTEDRTFHDAVKKALKD